MNVSVKSGPSEDKQPAKKTLVAEKDFAEGEVIYTVSIRCHLLRSISLMVSIYRNHLSLSHSTLTSKGRVLTARSVSVL